MFNAARTIDTGIHVLHEDAAAQVKARTAPKAAHAGAVSRLSGTASEDPSGRVRHLQAAHVAGRELVRVQGLCKVFGNEEQRVLRRMRRGESFPDAAASEHLAPPLSDVDLSVREGEIYVIMGLSGSGKSTLVRCINGLIRPTHGDAFVDGVAVSAASPSVLRELRQRRMSMVFQSFALLPHLSVAENVEFGLMLRKDDRNARRKRMDEVVEMVGLSEWKNRRIDELSGGMKQRIGLARALAPNPDILIMDEPFSALDPLIRRSLQDELLRLQKELRKTILFVTHDFAEAARIGSRISIMKSGRVVQVGTAAELYRQPCDDYVRAFTAHADRMQLLTVDELVERVPLQPDESQAIDIAKCVLLDGDASIAELMGKLKGGGRVAISPAGGGPSRILSSEVLIAQISALYSAGEGR